MSTIQVTFTLPSIQVSTPPSNSEGDMLKSIYDNDNDGVVNDSHRLAGQLASHYALASQLLNIDTNPTSGPRTISIGAADADFITIGNAGSQINLIGDVFVQDVNNVAVQNKLADLNVGAPANSGSGVGFNVIENATPTGWFKTNATRNGYLMKSPTSHQAEIVLSELTDSRQYTLPNESGQIAINLDAVPNVDATNPQNIIQTSDFQFSNAIEKAYWNGKMNNIPIVEINNAEFTGTITWTGTAPNGTTDHRITVYRIGKLVSFFLSIEYANAGASQTSITVSNLTQLPNPATNSNYELTQMYVQLLQGRIMTSSKSSNALNISPIWRVNAAGNGFEIITAPTFSSGAYRYVIIHGSYIC
jgi:hypothetical protein